MTTTPVSLAEVRAQRRAVDERVTREATDAAVRLAEIAFALAEEVAGTAREPFGEQALTEAGLALLAASRETDSQAGGLMLAAVATALLRESAELMLDRQPPEPGEAS